MQVQGPWDQVGLDKHWEPQAVNYRQALLDSSLSYNVKLDKTYLVNTKGTWANNLNMPTENKIKEWQVLLLKCSGVALWVEVNMGFIGNFEGSKGKLAAQLGEALGMGLGELTGSYFANNALDSVINDKSLKDADPMERQSALMKALSPYGKRGQNMLMQRLGLEQKEEQKRVGKLASRFAQGDETLSAEEISEVPSDVIQKQLQLQIANKKSEAPAGGITAQSIPSEVAEAMSSIADSYPNASAEKLETLFAKGGIPPIFYKGFIESRRRTQEKRSERLDKRDEKFIDENRVKPSSLAIADASAQTIRQNIKNTGPFSLANLAERSGMKEFQTASGAALATATKNFLMGDLANLSGRPNQFIEQRILDSLAKIGQPELANAAAARQMMFKVDADKKFNDILTDLEESEDYPPGKMNSVAQRRFNQWLETSQKDFLRDLERITNGDMSSVEINFDESTTDGSRGPEFNESMTLEEIWK